MVENAKTGQHWFGVGWSQRSVRVRLEHRWSAYSGCMRIALIIVGVVVTLFGLLWALQGFGVVGGSPMSNTTTWSIIGPIVALIGIAIAVGAARRKS
jgi:hypothetical protein